ncbi:MAG: flagellar hook-basal body protein [Planctomycetota bacterium]|nr:flagellar hook-basal body protein [Planctomycetota bacterium]
MNYGLYLSAAGALSALHRQDVFSNNLANMDTIGFKPDTPIPRERLPETQEDGLAFLPSNKLLERLGGGVWMAPTRTSFSQGSFETTGNRLDLAIQGEGFFVARDATDVNTDKVRLTRDGRFALNANGRLVMASSGMPILDVANQPIDLPPGEIRIDPNGMIRVNGLETVQIQITAVPDESRLRKLGDSLFLAPADAIDNRSRGAGRVIQGSLEMSTVDEVKAIMQVTSAGREVDANVAMMQQHDRMSERLIGVLGRSS